MLVNCCLGNILPKFLFVKHLLIAEIVTLQSNFLVEVKGTQAVLSWPKPTGSFTKQVIEKWMKVKREKRETVSDCMKAGNCEEEVIPIEQTLHTTDVDPENEYKFILVLYDGEVRVAQFKPLNVKPEGRLVKFSYIPFCSYN